MTFSDYAKSKGIELLRDDIKHIKRSLLGYARHTHKAILQQYTEAWLKAMANEPDPIRKQNAGRRAGNALLTDLY